MERRNFLKNMGLLSAGTTLPLASVFANTASGFTSVAISGKVTSNGKGLAGVVMSDGYQVVQTNKEGKYNFVAHYSASHVFISVPAGHEIPNHNGIAAFYATIDKTQQQQTANFDLQALPQNDDKHAFIIWGDTQIQTKDDAQKLKSISAPDTKELINSLGNVPVHGICCGDLVFDKFELYPDYKEAVKITSIPFYQLVGNHDIDYTARTDDNSQASFKAAFGPTYYSFNRGKIHYIVLDDVFFIGAGHRYIGYLTENQLAWVEKDLQTIPKGSTLVVSLHIPTNNGVKKRANLKEDELGGVVSNRAALYELVKDYKVHIMSGHTHWNENWEEGNIMEHNHGTVCGAWWTGPICGDGTPSGYALYEVNGSEITWFYKSVGFDKTHQMHIYKKGDYAAKPNAVLVNVWNYDAKWKVEWLEDGVAKGNMQQISDYDPAAYKLYKGPEVPVLHKWVEPVLTDHLFTAVPSANAKQITVRATDRFGNVYVQTNVL